VLNALVGETVSIEASRSPALIPGRGCTRRVPAENGGVGRYAQRQGEHGSRSETRAGYFSSSDAIAQILK
jgi:hypothetical protein